MARRSSDETKQAPWTQREVVITGVVVGCVLIWWIVYEHRSDEFLDRTHQIEAGMSLQQAVSILGEPTRQQESSERFLHHDERPENVELGEKHPLIKFAWDGPGYVFHAFVVHDQIIATRIRDKRPKP